MVDAGRLETRTFVSRLLATAAKGQDLGDPRSPGAITAWTEICDGIPDAMLKEMIPGTVRLLFRKKETARSLAACGLREGISLQHEAIAPYIIAFRRMREIRRHGGLEDPSALLVETRKELRELNTRFHTALDEAMRLQADNVTLRKDLGTARKLETAARAEADRLRQERNGHRATAEKLASEAQLTREEVDALKAELERSRKETERQKGEAWEQRRAAAVARSELEDVAARALQKFSFALQNLKETMDRRTNDPNSTLLEHASLSVQSYYMVLEDLGRAADAMKLARKVLGDRLEASGFR